MDTTLEKIRDFADNAHGEQMRKYSPDRYIVHPIRVMKTCNEYTNDTAVLAAALLHDVLEDTPVDEAALHQYLLTVMDPATAGRTLKLVVELTDVYVKSNFPQLSRRIRKNKEADRMAATSADAQTIKYADIMDNCEEIVQQDPDFAHTFLHECKNLLKRMTQGNAVLYEKAINKVNTAILQLQRS